MAELKQVAQQALELPSKDRIALVRFLLEVDSAPASGGADEAWEQEIQRRIAHVQTGSAQGIPFAAVMEEADRRYRQ